jgi:hypothetical protein
MVPIGGRGASEHKAPCQNPKKGYSKQGLSFKREGLKKHDFKETRSDEIRSDEIRFEAATLTGFTIASCQAVIIVSVTTRFAPFPIPLVDSASAHP